MKGNTSSSAGSLPSLLPSEEEGIMATGSGSSESDIMAMADGPAAAATIIHDTKEEPLPLLLDDIGTSSRQIVQKSPITIRSSASSSSSLWELESTAAVAEDTVDVEDDSENKLKFDVPELKNIFSEVELLARSNRSSGSPTDWLGELRMEGRTSRENNGEGMTMVEHSNNNNKRIGIGGSTNNKTTDENNYFAHPSESQEELSLRSYSTLLSSPISYPQDNSNSDAMGLCTPPPSMNNQQHRTGQTLHQIIANTPTPPLSIQRRNKISSPPPAASSACNNIQKEWLDPFPTPDVSIHSLYGSPSSSSTLRGSGGGDLDDESDDCQREKRSLAITTNIMNTMPTFPPIEELNDHCSLSPLRPSSMTAATAAGGTTTKLTVRKVYSESNLPLLERISMESIWGALKSGPDGNELLSESNNNNNSEVVNAESKKMHRRRHSEMMMGTNQHSIHFDFRHDGERNITPPPLADEHYSIHRSLTTPVESTRDGLRKRSMQNPESTSSDKDVHETSERIGHRSAIASDNQRNEWAPGDPNILTNNMRFHALKIKSSKAVASAKNSAGEVFSPVRTVVQQGTQHAAKLVRHTRQRLKERKELRKQRRLVTRAQSSSSTTTAQSSRRSWWIVIPADHPYKIIWDVLTMLWAALGAYRTHVRIRDRVFDQSPLIILTEIWFTVDILLNFITEHKTSEGDVIRDGKAVWARYLTTWFVIDILSLIPWERIYVRPIVERIKRRNFFQKTFFRSKAVVRVSRVLRGRHIKLFGKVSKRTGMSLHRIVALLIKYLPKYLLFLRNMKGALVIRALRFVHWLHNIYKKIWVKARNARQNLAVRHPLFSPNDTDFDADDDEDTDDDDDDAEEDDDDSDNEDQPRRRLFTES